MNQKLSIIVLAAAVFATACVREAIPAPEAQDGIICRIKGSSPETKTAMKDDPGVRMVSKWHEDDAIGIFGSGISNQNYQIVSSSISSDGKTAHFQSQSVAAEGTLLAYSPYQAGASRSGDMLIVEFPATQQYGVSGNIVGPDPSANILAGSGDSRLGISFRPVAAVLKIGQVFDKNLKLSCVEFRDLDGAAVCGAMRITPSATPSSEISGSGMVLSLTFGDGLDIEAGQKVPLYMIVPARRYAKGFSLTFVADDGSRTVKTIGTVSGKTLESGVVYPVGDITRYEYLGADSIELMDGALLVTAEKADLMKVIRHSSEALRGMDGSAIHYVDGAGTLNGPALELLVRDELGLQEGNYLIFENDSDILPSGGILKVQSCDDLGGGYHRVYASSEANVAAPYAKLQVGGKMYDEDGNLNEDEGHQVDLASYVTEVRNDDGEPVPYEISPRGELLFGAEATARLTGVQTKGSASPSYSFPGLSLNLKQDHAEAVFGASLTLNTRIAVGAILGEFQYLYITVNPVFNFSADFKLKAEFSKSVRKHLVTLYCAPIPVAPGVMVTPEMEIWAYVGIGGDLVFSASMKYAYDMGTFGIAYNKGDGFTTRHIPPKPADYDSFKLDGGSLTGTLYAHGGFELAPKFSIYGMLEAGVQANCGLKLGITDSNLNGWKSPKVFLQPMLEVYPVIATLGGYFTKSFKNLTLTIDIDPIWERYLWPRINLSYGFYGPTKAMKAFGYRSVGHDEYGDEIDVVNIMTPVFDVYRGYWFGAFDEIYTHVDGMRARVRSTVPTLDSWHLYVEYLEGGTLGLTDHQYAYLAPVWTPIGQASFITVTASEMAVKGRHMIADIPSGKKEFDNTADITQEIPTGKNFSYRFIMVNTATGKEYSLDREPIKGGNINMPYAFKVSWPKAPDGTDYFIHTNTIRAEKFDGSVPIKSLDSMYEVDGYSYPPDL